MITARDKLNGAALNGAVVIAGLVAGVTGSWGWFFLALLALLAAAVLSGDIRRPRPQS